MTVRVVTDSTADLPATLAQELNISVVPLTISFGAESYRDGIDLTLDQFFMKLPGAKVLPRTSPPSPGEFQSLYEGLTAVSDAIVSLHLSSKLSGTYETALMARDAVRKGQIEVIDSGSISLGLGLAVVDAAKAAKAGASVEEVIAAAQRVLNHHTILFVVDTLDYLQRGGRIGRAQAFLGSMFHIKPILSLQDGEIYPLERVRTRPSALDRLFELVMERQPIEKIVVVHATSPADAESLAQRFRAALPAAAVQVSRLGPVISVHVGPGVVGAIVLESPDGR